MTMVSALELETRLLRRAMGPAHTRPIGLTMSRTDLPALCHDLGFTRGAEIGVWRGAFSATFCAAAPALHMLCVDPWVSYPAWVDTKNNTADPVAFMAESYQHACNRLTSLNATIVRKFSEEAAPDVPDRSLDFVYIDGNHAFDAVSQDLALWAPKVRAGGFVAGHDFRAFANKPFIHVIEAVEAYTLSYDIDPWFVLAGDRTPSFLWVVR